MDEPDEGGMAPLRSGRYERGILWAGLPRGAESEASGFCGPTPGAPEKAIRRFKDWIVSHERQIAAAVALFAGAYMVISGILRLLS